MGFHQCVQTGIADFALCFVVFVFVSLLWVYLKPVQKGSEKAQLNSLSIYWGLHTVFEPDNTQVNKASCLPSKSSQSVVVGRLPSSPRVQEQLINLCQETRKHIIPFLSFASSFPSFCSPSFPCPSLFCFPQKLSLCLIAKPLISVIYI